MGVPAGTRTVWRAALDRRLESGALRVITPRTRPLLLKSTGVSLRSIDFWLRDRVADGALIPLQRGVYINTLAAPRVDLNEVACRLRPGAIISLASALLSVSASDSEMREPGSATYVVIPIRRGAPPPSLGVIDTVLGPLHIHGIPERILGAGALLDRLEPGHAYQRATPERALVDWLYLSRTRRSTVAPPPALEALCAQGLDFGRLHRLGRAAEIGPLVDDYLEVQASSASASREVINASKMSGLSRL